MLVTSRQGLCNLKHKTWFESCICVLLCNMTGQTLSEYSSIQQVSRVFSCDRKTVCKYLCRALQHGTVRVGQNSTCTPYMTVCMVDSLLKTPYTHRILNVCVYGFGQPWTQWAANMWKACRELYIAWISCQKYCTYMVLANSKDMRFNWAQILYIYTNIVHKYCTQYCTYMVLVNSKDMRFNWARFIVKKESCLHLQKMITYCWAGLTKKFS